MLTRRVVDELKFEMVPVICQFLQFTFTFHGELEANTCKCDERCINYNYHQFRKVSLKSNVNLVSVREFCSFCSPRYRKFLKQRKWNKKTSPKEKRISCFLKWKSLTCSSLFLDMSFFWCLFITLTWFICRCKLHL